MGIKEFFQTIQWWGTLQVAAIRIVIASILWPLLFIILGNTKVAEFFPLVFGFILVLAAFIAIAIPAIGLARANVPFVGLAALPAWMVVVADPLVKLLHAKRPDLVPVDEFKLINPPVLAIFQTGERYDGDADMSAGQSIQPASKQSIEGTKSSGLFEKLNSDDTSSHSSSAQGHSESNQDAQIIYEDGLRMFEEGDKKEGLMRVAEAVEVDPQHIDANLFLASVFHHIDPVENAEHVFLTTNNVLEVDSDNEKAKNLRAATHFDIGKQAWDMEDWSKATDAFIDAYNIEPTIELELLSEALAHCAEKGGFLLKAINAFEDRLKDDPGDVEARQLAGRSYIKLATSQDALIGAAMTQEEVLKRGKGHLSIIIERDPNNVDANYWLALAYVMIAQDDKVTKIIDILRPISPEKAAEIEQLMAKPLGELL